ncbi:carbohydrate porin [Aureliella helgolandensis]|uniref:carbohydrate porin n=1 Tax=Aureliella helgolandensis TaxID=2527968 RepID=UPI001E48F4A0|nr:carbohydrate porin [Aureliella helgolandensis]
MGRPYTDQALWVDPCESSRHWGYFAKAGIADDWTNPVSYLLSAGLGGASPLRSGDSFGGGYDYSGTSNEFGPILQTATSWGPIGDSQGVEIFYRARIIESVTVTPDFQWLAQAFQQIDDAYILGVRMNVAF